MRVLVQRVSRGGVNVEELQYQRTIGEGLVILLGIKEGDQITDAEYLADKCANLRIFEDESGKMNISVRDIGGEALVISQFTLYGDTQKGNRPNFTSAARPESAIPLYEHFIARLEGNLGKDKVFSGVFGAMMHVDIQNDGPVTVLVESK